MACSGGYVVIAPQALRTLQQHINSENLTAAKTIRIMLQITEAMSTLHGKNTVHGSLTPRYALPTTAPRSAHAALQQPAHCLPPRAVCACLGVCLELLWHAAYSLELRLLRTLRPSTCTARHARA